MSKSFEARRRALQTALDAQKTQSERNQMGQFSTPYPLAVDIITSLKPLIKQGSISFLEPAVGLGVFYSAFVKCLGNREHKAIGIEIDPHYAQPAFELWKDSHLKIVNCNFFALDIEEKFDLLVTNPPYVRHHHIAAQDKTYLQQMVKNFCGMKISGLAGLYCYFMMLSFRLMKKDGIMSFLVPSEFMDVNYGVSVKRFLLEKVELISIHRFQATDLQFDDALVSSCVVTFRNREPGVGHRTVFSIGKSVSTPDRRIDIPIDDLDPEDKWTNFFANGVERVQVGKTVGDYFNVKRGVATGENSFFLVGASEILKYNIPMKYIRPVMPRPRDLKVDVFEKEGDVQTKRGMVYIFSCNEEKSVLQQKYPGVYRYIAEGEARGVHKGYICKHRSPWYYCACPEPAPIVFPNMARENKDGKLFRFILNRIQAVATNSYLALYPKECCSSQLMKAEVLQGVWEALNELPKDVLSRCGRFYGGGLQKLEPKEVMAIPIDTLERWLNQNQAHDALMTETVEKVKGVDHGCK